MRDCRQSLSNALPPPCPMPHDGRCVTVGRAFPTHCLPHAPCPMPHSLKKYLPA
ncbi:MAG: hypothetical protein KME31_28770 [Tolypothrix carrinoi HA7290-LM1]|nr:hypothetical protein [Tolypothrix carrinoi HA7290-LM1]